MNSVLVHRSTDSKTPSCLIAAPLHKQVPITDEVAEKEAIEILNWLAETLPGSVYDIVIEHLKKQRR